MDDAQLTILATRMSRVFAGNTSYHYTADFGSLTIESGGKRVPRYNDVPGPPTLQEYKDHLSGIRGLLVCPVTKAGACRFGKIDIDEYPADPVKYAQSVKRWGLPLVVELSKSGGVHLSHYSSHTESAADMREKLADYMAQLRVKPGTEIFPKQEKLMDGEYGSGINLPYFGGNDAKNYAIDADGNRLSVEKWLDIIETLPNKPTHTPGSVNVEAAAELISRHWTDGQRDNLNMAVAGTLIRSKLDEETIQQILDASQTIQGDDSNRKTAAVIAQAIEGGNKRVPGYRALVELIGVEDAQELMRLAGAKPPPEALPFGFGTVTADWINVAPPPVTYTIKPLLPFGVVGLLVAEGGAGKTTFGLRMAIAIAGGRPLFGMETKMGRAVYIACEEHEGALRRRVYLIVNNEKRRMMEEGLSPEAIELFELNIMSNLTIRSAVGYEIYLISSKSGETSQTGLVQALIDRLPRPIELLVMDPISRLNGAEENSNQVGTALINSAERIAREVDCTVLLCHHTGKAAAKDRDTSLYAARGASGFVDAARSSIRLMAADNDDVRDFSNIPPGIVASGDLIQVIHNKSNEGPKAKPFWLRRQALDFELFEPQASTGALTHAKLLDQLHAWYCNLSCAPFSVKRIRDSVDLRKEIWPYANVSRYKAIDVIEKAQEDGDIIEAAEKAKNAAPLIRFREDFGGDSM